MGLLACCFFGCRRSIIQDFLAVSMTHGAATLGIYDQAMWDK
jgi:hypothetical protein